MALNNDQQLNEIIKIIELNSSGLARGEISDLLAFSINNKTLQRRLNSLCADGVIVKEGNRRATKYYPTHLSETDDKGQIKDKSSLIFSPDSQNVLYLLEKPLHARAKVSYNREFIENYVPNETRYVPYDIRRQLLLEGKRFDQQLAAGTYARQISQRLLIDLSYNSSRLEGNTYSRLDTQKLIEKGIMADGKIDEETTMIMNHKEAILFLIENAELIKLDCFTLFNLHNLLSQDLLANPQSCGNIRTVTVEIGKSSYLPLENPHILREMLELILVKANKIEDPFEQSFFLLVHLSYLQAFEDVNKRTSRLTCNIPFIKQNLCPLSFTDVPRDDYIPALLAIYELNDVNPMLDLFAWAYLRSCNQYDVVKESLGGIDAFRIQHRQLRKQVMGQVIRDNLHREEAAQLIEQFCLNNAIREVEKFTAMTMTDLDNLHAGAIIGLGISESQFYTWQAGK
ncbi:Fic family protein [Endozoicomonas sp. 4G]|uniref:Fic family protein n=1 Tax=Endozoicomonas sp. 4G TaxID=2872754 RepID=UPI00207850E4|nr:Fic family protein [Endozoicomonas sp. 4G]